MKKYYVLLIAAMATLGLSACDNGDSPADEASTVEESSMMDSVEEASEDAMDTIEEAIDDASDSMDEIMEGMDSTEEDLSESVENIMNK
jgi:peptidoglycan hydrolase CwlO-like protein